MVVVAAGLLDTVDSDVVTIFVVAHQSEVAASGTVVVGATWIGVDLGKSGAAVVEVLSSEEVVLRILSVLTTETSGTVVPGLVCSVVLLVVTGASGVSECVVFAEATVGKDTVAVWTVDEVRGGEVVEEAVLGKEGGMDVVVVRVILSTVTCCVLVSVYAVVTALVTVVMPVTADVCETGAGTGLGVVTIGVTTAERGVVVVGPSVELVVGVVVVHGCRVLVVGV